MKKPFYILTLLITAFSFQQCDEETPAEPTNPNLNPPEVLTTDFAEIETLSTTVNFELESVVTAWGEALTGRGICWNTTGSPIIADDKTTDETIAGELISTIPGLSRGNTYYFRAYATNEAGTAYGKVISYETSPIPTLAAVTTNAPTNIDPMDATLSITVTSGTVPLYMAGVYVSTNPTPTSSDDNIDAGPVDALGSYQINVGSLTPSTTYYVRGYVVNEAGESLGNIISFTTDPL